MLTGHNCFVWLGLPRFCLRIYFLVFLLSIRTFFLSHFIARKTRREMMAGYKFIAFITGEPNTVCPPR